MHRGQKAEFDRLLAGGCFAAAGRTVAARAGEESSRAAGAVIEVPIATGRTRPGHVQANLSIAIRHVGRAATLLLHCPKKTSGSAGRIFFKEKLLLGKHEKKKKRWRGTPFF